MMKNKILKLAVLLLALTCLNISAEEKEEFKPSGKFIIRSFFDYSTGLGHANKEAGFDLTRALIGYNYQITPTLQARVVIDGASGRTADNSLEVHVRNAYLNWTDYGLNVYVGEIGTLMFSTQEAYWKHRYVMKIYQDINKMGHSVDLGVTAQYKISNNLSADISILNGEGYKNVNKKNKSMKYAAGITTSFWEGATLRVYGDIYTKDETMQDELPENVSATLKNQYNIAVFAGYRNEKLSFGAEYNRIFNKGLVQDKEFFGYSTYGSVNLSKKCGIYARYDYTTSLTPKEFSSAWKKLDGQTTIVGVEFAPIKQLKISPNFRNINPTNSRSEQYIFLNMEIDI